MDRLASAIAILEDLVAFPTVSAAPNLEMVTYLATRLEDMGATVELSHDATGTKANVFATLGPEADGGLVLSGHTDVVPADGPGWTGDPFRLRRAQGRLYGRGTCDMKGFLAAVLACLPEFAGRPLCRPLHVAFTYDEEVGCLGAQQLVAELRRRGVAPAMAIVGEPTEMRVVEGHKGCNEYTTRFHGTDGHGSAPEKGVNAVEFAARFVHRLLEIRRELRERAPTNSRFDPPWSTLNVGRLQGGIARNVLAGMAEVEWETRPVTAEDARFVRAAVEALCSDVLLPEMQQTAPNARIETEVIAEIDGLLPVRENAARDLALALTGAATAGLVAFGTEAGLFQSMGMSVAICGPGSIAQAHQPDEYLEVAQLQSCLAMLEGLVPHLTAPSASASAV
ncbi:acetylornithine deacetylase [Tropicimonas marinistellae]|uniref:acetylornithine deacetylase n=1 Tax=Tropicimonas marinistellae TaxID=1739787 RepID=UPI000829BC8C|nr:acetylornithine deacetylase [Tropicimonas marinistellae]